MCDRCSEIEKEFGTDELEQLEEFDSLESIQGAYENSFLQPLEVSIDLYDNDDFIAGFNSFQKLAGSIVALTNIGLHVSDALNYISNQENIKHNLEIAKINSEMNIQISKNQQAIADKNQL
jgi:hypothetical protein